LTNKNCGANQGNRNYENGGQEKPRFHALLFQHLWAPRTTLAGGYKSFFIKNS
jgi:hypothetical protein